MTVEFAFTVSEKILAFGTVTMLVAMWVFFLWNLHR